MNMAISSKWLKLCRALHHKKYRQKEQLFLVEGAKSVQELLSQGVTAGFRIKALFATRKFIESTPVLQQPVPFLLQTATDEELSRAGTTQTNQTALAVVQVPQPTEFVPSNQWLLALASIRDPGNLGTIIRIADWYGIDRVVCSPDTAEWYNPKVISASMGSFLRVQPFYTDLAEFFSRYSIVVYGALLDGESIYKCSPSKKGAILIGNESHGIPLNLLPFVNYRLAIPRIGKAESLNAAIAAAIFCDRLVGQNSEFRDPRTKK